MKWNRMDYGNIGFVYMGAMMRIMFLMGVGLSGIEVKKAGLKSS